MKWIPFFVLGAFAIAGCSTSHRYSDSPERSYVVGEQPGDRIVVREYERPDRRGTPSFQNNMEPRVRGKHADSLGWNTETYYLQRGY